VVEISGAHGPGTVPVRVRGQQIGKLADSHPPAEGRDTFSVPGHASQGDDP
jgi:hypothetical protein